MTRAQQFEILAAGVLYDGAVIATPYAKFLIAGTTTAKNAWEDADKSVAITKKALDAQGRAVVYGDGTYKIQIYSGDPDAGGVLKFTVDGYKVTAVQGNARTITQDTAGSEDDGLILGDTTSNNITYDLPSAVPMAGRTLTIKKTVAANTLTYQCAGASAGQTIDGEVSGSLTDPNATIQLISDGTDWHGAQIVGTASTVGGFAASAEPTIGNIPVLGTGARVLIDVQVFTASGTWTKPAGCTAAEVWVIGGGGGGGGVGATGASQGATAGGGSGGGGSYEYITSGLGATETVTVGAGGNGGTAGANNGFVGGTSSFGSHCSAPGGGRGLGDSANTAGTPGAASDPPGIGSGGSVNLYGSYGATASQRYGAAAFCVIPTGGGAPFGFTSHRPTIFGASGGSNGVAGSNYGCGGDGAINIQNGTAKAGGAGSAGIVIVKSYS